MQVAVGYGEYRCVVRHALTFTVHAAICDATRILRRANIDRLAASRAIDKTCPLRAEHDRSMPSNNLLETAHIQGVFSL